MAAYRQGAQMLRVHDVAETAQALAVEQALASDQAIAGEQAKAQNRE
jgi:dihydropteroate synthase